MLLACQRWHEPRGYASIIIVLCGAEEEMFMSAVIEQSLTAEEFARLPNNGKQQALVRGKVVETMPPGGEHAWIASEIDF